MGNIEKQEAVKLANSIVSKFRAACSSKVLFKSERKQKRTIKLPVSQSLYREKGPNPTNENSAITITYQVKVYYFFKRTSNMSLEHRVSLFTCFCVFTDKQF